MKRKTTLRRGLLAALAVMTLGGAFASPHAAFADPDKDKGKKVPIIIGPITTTPDPDPTPPPKKKS